MIHLRKSLFIIFAHTDFRVGRRNKKMERLKAMGAVSKPLFLVDNYRLVGALEHDWIIFHFIYGMSSFPRHWARTAPSLVRF